MWQRLLRWMRRSSAAPTLSPPSAPAEVPATVAPTPPAWRDGELRAAVVAIARGELGVTEDPGQNNVGARIREYQQATTLGPGPFPWCAAFTAWVLWQAIRQTEGLTFARCRSARVQEWVRWAQQHPAMQVRSGRSAVEPGDFIVFLFPSGHHIGIAETAAAAGAPVSTIDGNTTPSGADANDSTRGDGVHRKVRRRASVIAVLRIHAVRGTA
jgi:hypothetical protein